MIFHLFKKDTYALRFFLIAWIAALAMGCVAPWVVAVNESLFWAPAAGWMATIMPFLKIGLAMTLLIQLLLADRPKGTTAFWLTRPIAPRQMVGAKLLFLAVWIVLLPTLVEGVMLTLNGVLARDLAPALAETILKTSALWIAMATFTLFSKSNFSTSHKGEGNGGSALGGLGFAVVMWAHLFWMFRSEMHGFGPSDALLDSRLVVVDLIVILGGVALVVHQYATRRSERTGIGVALVGAIVLGTLCAWPWLVIPQPRLAAAAPEVSESLQPHWETPPHLGPQGLLQSKSTLRIGREVRITGAPAGIIAEVQQVHSQLRRDGAVVLDQTFAPSDRHDTPVAAMEHALGGIRVFNPYAYSKGASVPLLVLRPDLEQQTKHADFRLQSELELALSRYEITGEMPLQKGAALARGSDRDEILGWRLQDSEKVEVSLWWRHLPLLFAPNPLGEVTSLERGRGRNVAYLLVNRKRGEALLPSTPFNSFPQIGGWWHRFQSQASKLSFDSNHGGGDRRWPVLDAAWLADATLVRLDRVPVAQCKRTVRDEAFYLDSERWEEAHR
jgi:hypothetical protein